MAEAAGSARASGLTLRSVIDARFTGFGRPLAVAGALFAALLFVLFARPFSYLPDYPATLAAFVAWAIVPGWLLQRALLNDRRAGVLERLSVAFLASMAIAALPGLAALRLHWSLDAFGATYALFAAIASGLALYLGRDDEASAPETPEAATGPMLALLALLLLAILLSPLWSGERVSRDFGDFEYMRFVNHYVTTGTLDPSDPRLSGSTGGFGRLGVNVWLGAEALLADDAGVSPYGLLMDHLPPIMTVLAIAAVFTLARGLFRSTRLAALTSLIALGYGAIDLSAYETYGRNLFLRSDQDKLVVSLVLVPLGLLFACRFLQKPNARDYIACLLAAAALLVVHPMGIEFLGLALVSIAVLRAFAERSVVPLRSAGLVLLPWALPLVAALAWSVGVGEPGLEAFGDSLELQTYDAIVRLGHGLVMGNYHLILHPLMLASIVIAPILWLRAPRSIGTQMLAAVTVSAVLLLFVPVLSTPFAKVVSEQGVWRLPWLIPVPIVIAHACNEALNRFLPAGRAPATPVARATIALAGIGIVVAVLAAAFVVQEQYARIDGGSYYIRTSPAQVLAGDDGSIGWGGIEYAFGSGWRPGPQTFRLVHYLNENIPAGASVALPLQEGFLLPALLDDVHVAGYLGGEQYAAQREAVARFYGGLLTPPTAPILRANGVDYVVVRRDTFAARTLGVVAEFDANRFQPISSPAPEFLSPADGYPYAAWLLRPDGPDAIGQMMFRVPADTARDGPAVTLVIGGVPSQVATDGQTVRLLIDIFETLDGAIYPAPLVQQVDDIVLDPGDAAIVGRELIDAQLTPGAIYAVSITRLGNDQADTFPGNMQVVGITETYRSANLIAVPGTGYDVFRLPPAP